jgi:hypothetical protein
MASRKKMTGHKYFTCALLVLVFSLAFLLTARSISAQQLPVRTYTTDDGLPRDLVLRIVRDSHGFLWFCTGDGLSRFNGYEFTTYGLEHGLPHPVINDLLETRRGAYWVATNGGGVARFNPSTPPNEQPQTRSLFTAFPVGDKPTSNRVNILIEDRLGQVWAGTDGGLFRLDETSGANRISVKPAVEAPCCFIACLPFSSIGAARLRCGRVCIRPHRMRVKDHRAAPPGITRAERLLSSKGPLVLVLGSVVDDERSQHTHPD